VLKAGVMEIADIYAINKADRPGADRLCNEIEVMLGIRRGNAFRHVAPHHRPEAARPVAQPAGSVAAADWEPPALTLSALRGEGMAELVEAIERHAEFLRASGELERRRRDRLARHTREVVDRSLRHLVWEEGNGEAALRAGLAAGDERVNPYELAHRILADVRRELHDGRP
jgi:LAO/AO transport system kinase